MDLKETLRLLLPLLSIVISIVIKNSNNENYASVKQYWLFFVVLEKNGKELRVETGGRDKFIDVVEDIK